MSNITILSSTTCHLILLSLASSAIIVIMVIVYKEETSKHPAIAFTFGTINRLPERVSRCLVTTLSSVLYKPCLLYQTQLVPSVIPILCTITSHVIVTVPSGIASQLQHTHIRCIVLMHFKCALDQLASNQFELIRI